MDDKEYYTLMNRSSCYALLQDLKKKQSRKSVSQRPADSLFKDNFHNLEVRQGKADAEMLMEKEQE